MAKPQALCDIIETERPLSTIVFCNTKSDTSLVEALLRRRGFDARRLNSDLQQKQRNRVMNKIRNGELPVLVATDIAARGLDIEQIDLVVNFSLHQQQEVYVHRTGRTGRAGRSGRAITLVGPKDFGQFHYLTKVLTSVEFKEYTLPNDEEVAKARLAHLLEIVRKDEVNTTQRDLAVASLLFKELGDEKIKPDEDFQAFIAKVARYVLQHHVKQEAESLEDELEEKSSKNPASTKTAKTRSESKTDDREKAKSRNGSKERTSRLFFSLGKEDGLGKREIVELVKRLADMSDDEISHVSTRENYLFLDVPKRKSKAIIKALNGVSHNDKTLKVELAENEKKNTRRGQNSGKKSEHRDT